jgi:hypothetical protein
MSSMPSATQEQVDCLTAEIQKHLDRFKRKQSGNRTMAAVMRGGSILLGAVTTVALGLSGYVKSTEQQQHIAMLALVLSAILTSLSAWEAFAEYAWRWTQAHRALAAVHGFQERLGYELSKGELPSSKFCDDLQAEIEALLKAEEEAWSAKRAVAILSVPQQPKRP